VAGIVVKDDLDSVVKSPPYGVTAFFQALDILMYVFIPEKTPGIVGGNLCLAILKVMSFRECIDLG
jgi:hypothetical protein